MMRIGLPYADLWNAWWSDYGNSPAEFAVLRERVEAAAAEAGRGPGEVGATAAVLVQLAGGVGRVMGDSSYQTAVTPVRGEAGAIADHMHAMAAAGAVHVQLVLDPITVHSIATVAEAVAMLDRG
jgi:alkanesulfonate monooxygenase SsuD/methylene tetrahydromethanopterin reductase-like flavin-dependent oxidoreductase (luciferase family)